MQIVIDIPDEMYDWYDNGFPDEDDAEKLWQIIKNGIPLPRGHGRLKDIDKFPVNEIERMKYNYECGENECRSEEIVYLDDIINAETIIEADKEEEE